MGPSDIWLLLILFVLVVLSAFFSATETAITAVNRHKLRTLSDSGNKKATLLLSMLENQDAYLSTILIGNNVVNLTASAIAAVVATHIGGRFSVGIATGILTLVVLIFGEICPKTTATIRAEKIALRFCGVLKVLHTILTPIRVVIQLMARGVLALIHVDPEDKPDAMTEDELRTIVQVSHEEGVIESEEKEMINNVFDLGESMAKDVMIPRVDVIFADIDMTYPDLIALFAEERFTRIPIYEESADTVVGILNMKDLLLYHEGEPFSIRDYMREPFFTHEFKKTSELFVEMRQNTAPMAIVLDEYGVTSGVITIEDILEEIVGEIRDEYDESELLDIQKVSDNEYIVVGSQSLNDINDELETDFTNEEYDSIGGYMIWHLDHFPEQGEEVTDEEGNRLIAEEVDGNHIEKVRLLLAPKKEDYAEDEE